MFGCIVLAIIVVNSPQVGGIAGLKQNLPEHVFNFFQPYLISLRQQEHLPCQHFHFLLTSELSGGHLGTQVQSQEAVDMLHKE